LPAAPPHDPHDRPHEGGLSPSVLIGLALLPFVIPLLWLLAPLAAGQPPALSLAAPTALAVAASALSLAVIYTVDWSAATRVKGVLMLVGLAYFAGFSLYFLKKDMLDRVKRAFDPAWHDYSPPGQDFKVRLPGKPVHSANTLPLGDGWRMECYHAAHQSLAERHDYLVGAGTDPHGGRDAAAWFAEVRRLIVAQAQGGEVADDGLAVQSNDGSPGREWVVKLTNGATRVVRVYRSAERKRVYYLAVEAPELSAEDDEATKFLHSLTVRPKE
jgi:hypothetical protein